MYFNQPYLIDYLKDLEEQSEMRIHFKNKKANNLFNLDSALLSKSQDQIIELPVSLAKERRCDDQSRKDQNKERNIFSSLLPDSTQTNIIKFVKKVEDFEEYQSQCKSILQKKYRRRDQRDESKHKKGSQRRLSSKFFDDKVGKRRADSQERPLSKSSDRSDEYKKKLPQKRRFENFADKFSEPRLEDYDNSYGCEESQQEEFSKRRGRKLSRNQSHQHLNEAAFFEPSFTGILKNQDKQPEEESQREQPFVDVSAQQQIKAL